MTNTNTPTMTTLIWNTYYQHQLGDSKAISDYLDGYEPDPDSADPLIDAIYEDIRDLLHNGNSEELWGSYFTDEADEDAYIATLHDGWRLTPDPLMELSTALALRARSNAANNV